MQNVLMNNEQPNIFFVPYRGYAAIDAKENTAVSNYNALQVNFRHTFGYWLNFQAAYTSGAAQHRRLDEHLFPYWRG